MPTFMSTCPRFHRAAPSPTSENEPQNRIHFATRRSRAHTLVDGQLVRTGPAQSPGRGRPNWSYQSVSHTRGLSAAGRRLQAKLSRNSNQVAHGRIRQFESDMPSQAVPVSPHIRLASATAAAKEAQLVTVRWVRWKNRSPHSASPRCRVRDGSRPR
jgi:hypothetical protein